MTISTIFSLYKQYLKCTCFCKVHETSHSKNMYKYSSFDLPIHFFFQKAGVKISIRQLEILIESLDMNKDGNIDFR